jgi:hypothetical protein
MKDHYLNNLIDVIVDMRWQSSNQDEMATYNQILDFIEGKM